MVDKRIKKSQERILRALTHETIEKTLTNSGPKYMELGNNKFVYYSNSTMRSGDWIGHSGLGGQFLAINLKTRIVAAYFSVIDTPSGQMKNIKKNRRILKLVLKKLISF